jgi:hypothetical protein
MPRRGETQPIDYFEDVSKDVLVPTDVDAWATYKADEFERHQVAAIEDKKADELLLNI